MTGRERRAITQARARMGLRFSESTTTMALTIMKAYAAMEIYHIHDETEIRQRCVIGSGEYYFSG